MKEKVGFNNAQTQSVFQKFAIDTQKRNRMNAISAAKYVARVARAITIVLSAKKNHCWECYPTIWCAHECDNGTNCMECVKKGQSVLSRVCSTKS